jgi:hypothetical protein
MVQLALQFGCSTIAVLAAFTLANRLLDNPTAVYCTPTVLCTPAHVTVIGLHLLYVTYRLLVTRTDPYLWHRAALCLFR